MSEKLKPQKEGQPVTVDMGLEHLLGLLPEESKKELRSLLNSGREFNLPYDYDQMFKGYRKQWSEE
ncbi:hypothetical protein [Ammoniphilus sp. 3BR4]|uniref:hypothetical protein n=1 Tax=Ammoniphilus sp. 3BR4 TaxID=3158265 RepID=UPI00346654AC